MNMGRIAKRTLALLAALCLTLHGACALADVAAEADRASVQAGDTITVTLTITGKKLAVAEGTYAYDLALLAFKQSDGGAADGFFTLYSAEKNGSSTLAARITFTALAAGEAVVDFKLDKLLDYAGKSLDTGGAKVKVVIAAAPAAPTPTPVDYGNPKLTVKAENVQGASADMYVWRSIENVTIPSRYTETDLTYRGESVRGATVKNSDAPTLLYLSDALGNNAGYYVYDEARDMFYPYRTVSSVSKSYILLEPEENVLAPAGFAQTTLSIGGVEVKAWESKDAQGSVYLLYARNPDGEIGFYYYNPEDESLQRYAVLPVRPEVTPPPATPSPASMTPQAPQQSALPQTQPAADEITLKRAAFFAVCGAAALFLGLFVTSLAVRALEKARRKKRAAQRRREVEQIMEASQKPVER